MQVPAASAVEQAVVPLLPTGGAEPTKKCPFCGETVLKVARRCKHCKADMPEGCDGESVRARLTMKEKKLAEQLSAGQMPVFNWPRLRTLTIVLAGVSVLLLLITVLSFAAKNDDWVALGVLGVISLIILGICLLVAFINDMQMMACSHRKTPEKALKAFMYSLARGKYECAYACLLDGDKDELERVRRSIPNVSVSEARVSFADCTGFMTYWKELLRPTGLQMRRAVLSNFRLVRTQGDYAVASVAIKIESYPWPLLLALPLALLPVAIVISVITKRETFEVSKLLRKAEDKWYLVNGELDSMEDRSIDLVAKGGAFTTA